MRWSRVSTCALSLTCVLAALGCGGSGFSGQGSSDSLTMSFQEFSGEGIMQQDTITNTAASVDVCQDICSFTIDQVTGVVTTELEQFTETVANAVFINNGTADILLDRYTITYLSPPSLPIPPRTVQTAVLLPGGRCTGLPNRKCGTDADCGIALPCEHTSVDVGVLLYDFATKVLIVGDQQCPTLQEDDQGNVIIVPGDVTPVSFQTNVTFSGSDETGKRFTVKTGILGSFFDANNCTTNGSGGTP
jgi:hypothetical protein